MAVTKKIIGRIPICFGTWYPKQGGWGIKNRVTLYGSEFESLHENNTVPPAVYDEIENTVTFNENDWRVISNGTEAWLADAKIDALGTWEENPEFVEICLDKNGRIIYGAQRNGNFVFGAGVPEQIKEYFKEHGGDLIHDIEAFLAGFDGDETLKEYLEEIYGKYEENPEFVELKLDANGYILWGIKKDGDIVFGCGIPREIQNALNKINKDIDDNFGDIRGTFRYITNPEYLFACLDAEDRFLYGVTVEGKFRAADLEFELPEEEAKWLNTVFSLIDDPEGRLEVSLDGENKILSWRDDKGVKHETKLAIEHSLELSSEAMAGFQQAMKDAGINLDTAGKNFVANLPKYGSVNIKSETIYLVKTDGVSSLDDVHVEQILQDTNENAYSRVALSRFYKNGTSHSNSEGILCFASSDVSKSENRYYATTKVVKLNDVCYYQNTIGTTNADNPVRNVVIPGYSVEAPADSELQNGETKDVTIEVDKFTWTPDIKVWLVDKKVEHNCLVDIDFGHYLSGTNMPIGVKYQGASTTTKRKRNFRFTFYKNNSYSKENKIKIGEMVRLSEYNLKANWSDNSRVKELVLFAVICSVWNERPITDRYPWESEFGYYTGATGFIKGFPITVNIGNEFYGLEIFSLKKDERNYMLDGDDDGSGIFVCGSKRDANCWKNSVASDWKDEMMDEMSQETADAITEFLSFVNTIFVDDSDNRYNWQQITFFVDDTAYSHNSVYLNKNGKLVVRISNAEVEITNAYVTNSLEGGVPTASSIEVNVDGLNPDIIEENMDVLGFIDYFLCMQAFLMWDSICRNVILHTRSDKKKFYPYFYDLDLSMESSRSYNDDLFDIAYNVNSGQISYNDMSLWANIKNMYWDQIVNRWCELRKTVLNIDYIERVYHTLTDEIPNNVFVLETNKWGTSVNRSNFDAILTKIKLRLAWLDTNYFIV